MNIEAEVYVWALDYVQQQFRRNGDQMMYKATENTEMPWKNLTKLEKNQSAVKIK